MNWDQMEGKWMQIKGSVKERWGKLTDDDLDVIAGKRDKLIGKVQERYGIAKGGSAGGRMAEDLCFPCTGIRTQAVEPWERRPDLCLMPREVLPKASAFRRPVPPEASSGSKGGMGRSQKASRVCSTSGGWVIPKFLQPPGGAKRRRHEG
jgi:uncharacterized protein YjbJ (UPF0337 family)